MCHSSPALPSAISKAAHPVELFFGFFAGMGECSFVMKFCRLPGGAPWGQSCMFSWVQGTGIGGVGCGGSLSLFLIFVLVGWPTFQGCLCRSSGTTGRMCTQCGCHAMHLSSAPCIAGETCDIRTAHGHHTALFARWHTRAM